MISNKIAYIIAGVLLVFLVSCKSSSVLTMERGIYFYENNDFHEAAAQFNKVIFFL